MHQITEWFISLDQPMRSAVIGLGGTVVTAFIALLALFLNLRFSRWKHRRDAEMALRKEIYIGAADALSDAFSTLTLLPRADAKLDDGAAALRKFSAAAGKIITVATPPTQKVIFDVVEHYIEAFEELSRRKLILNEGLDVVAQLTERLRQVVELRNGAIAYRDQTLPTLATDRERVTIAETVIRDVDRLNQEEQSLNIALAEFQKNNQRNFLDATKFATDNLIKFGRINIDLVLAFRNELGLSSDEAWYRTYAEGAIHRAQQRYERTLADLNAKLLGPSAAGD